MFKIILLSKNTTGWDCPTGFSPSTEVVWGEGRPTYSGNRKCPTHRICETQVTNDRSIHAGESLWDRDTPQVQVELIKTGV